MAPTDPLEAFMSSLKGWTNDKAKVTDHGIREEGKTRMVKATHKLSREFQREFDARLREMLDKIQKETEEKLISAHLEARSEKSELEEITSSQEDRDLTISIFSSNAVAEYLRGVELFQPPDSSRLSTASTLLGRPASPELGSRSPNHGCRSIHEWVNPGDPLIFKGVRERLRDRRSSPDRHQDSRPRFRSRSPPAKSKFGLGRLNKNTIGIY